MRRSGHSAGAPESAEHLPQAVGILAAPASAASSSVNRVLPMPGSPRRTIIRPRPARASVNQARSSASSRERPTKRAAPKAVAVTWAVSGSTGEIRTAYPYWHRCRERLHAER